MVDKILKELKDKLIEVASCGEDSHIAIGFDAGYVTMNNVVRADEILISEEQISIESDNLLMNVSCGCGTSITKINYGVEIEYCINNHDMHLYICLIGT